MSSGGGQRKGQQEARAAMTELIQELDRTRKEYAKATLQLTQLETTVQHLKDAELKKDQVISHLEGELERRAEQHRIELGALEEEHRTKDAAWVHRVKQLEIEQERLQQENQAMSMFEKENRQLRDTVLENQAVMERLQLINDDLRSRAREDSKEHAALLEDEFRRRLAESEKRFRAEAYRALSEEAKLALQGNDHLQTVLQRQNDSIEAVLLRCKQLEQSHSKIQQEQELGTQNLQHHMTEIQRLKKQLSDSRAKNTQLEDALKQRKVERASLELLFIEYEASRKQLAKTHEKCRRAVREAERWRNRAVQLTRELGDEHREAGEAKLQAIQAQSDAIEQHLAVRRTRSARRERTRRRAQEGAATLQAARGDDTSHNSPGDDGDDGDDWSQVSEEGVVADLARHRAVNPMEILAMWNVNFESWCPTSSQADDQHAGAEEAAAAATAAAPGVEEVPQTRVDGAGELPMLIGDRAPACSDPADDAAPSTDPGVGPLRALPPPRMAHAHGAPRPRGVAGAAPRVDEQRVEADKRLSALAQPRSSTLPPPARHYAGLAGGALAQARGTRAAGGSAMAKTGGAPLAMSVVARGEFKMSKKAPDFSQQRFLVP